MTRRRNRHDVARTGHGALGDALLKAMQHDLDSARDGLRRLADQVEANRASNRDVAEQENKLAELILSVAGMSAHLDAMRHEAGYGP